MSERAGAATIETGMRDTALPAGVPAPSERPVERSGVRYRAASWTPAALAALTERLAARGAGALATLSRRRLLDAWDATVAAFRDPESDVSRRLRPALARLAGLSSAGLAAALEAVLGGVGREHAREVIEGAEPTAEVRGPVWVVLASNLPALAVQPLLPALAVGRPALLESPSAEPLFAPAFVAELGRREPALRDAVAAVTWKGGDVALERAVLARAARVVAYGDAETMAALAALGAGERLIAYGPKLSLAAIGREVDPSSVARGLARDVALFDQRGCLSIQAIYIAGGAGDAEALARALAAALLERAAAWPPGPAEAGDLAPVQHLRAEAAMRGLFAPELPVGAGTVIVEPRPALRASPGLRTVRVHPLPSLAALPDALAGWEGRLQGAALAGDDARALEPALAALGVSRFAAPGALQAVDASWHNGGISPLAALA